MYKFQIKPTIYEFKCLDDFINQFGINERDTIFTEKMLYEKYLYRKVKANYIFQDDFGLGEPSDIVIDKIFAVIKGQTMERIIGIGGGTILDIVKLLSIKDATSTEDIFEDKIPLIRDKKLILVPTTCGTGCEVTAVSVVDFPKKHTKMGKRIEAGFADEAVLIEELLADIPWEVFLLSSIDALIHAMEIFVAPTGNPYNDIFCKESIRIILNGYKGIAKNGVETRFEYIQEFLRASNFAGIALSNTLCGAVHAFAMHFGSMHHVPHGESNARFLNAVFNKYAAIEPNGKLKGIAEIINESLGLDSSTTIRESFCALEELINTLLPRKKLREYGMKEEDLERYVDKVIQSQQRLLKNNYVFLGKNDLMEIYGNVY